MKKEKLIIIMLILVITGCSNYQKFYSNKKKEGDNLLNINIIINDKKYILYLENNSTVEDFIKLLPNEYLMSELNGNEKYVYLNTSLQTNEIMPKKINKGDVMLYGNNCLVIFYKTFNTNYNYTRIGHIDNLDDLNNDNIYVKFEK